MIVQWALAMVLMATPVRDPLAPYRGQPVVAIDIQAPESENQSELRALIEIQPGYLLSSTDVQTALKRLYALGRFADIGVTAERLSGSVILHFYLKPTARLSELKLRTRTGIDEAALLNALRLGVGSEVDRRTPQLIVERAKAYLAKEGYPNAEAWVRESEKDERARSYEVIVDEKEPRLVQSVRFSGAPGVKANVLRSLIATTVGDILKEDRLEQDKKRLEQAFLSRGFLQAKVNTASVTGDATHAVVTFDVIAGPRVAVFFKGHSVLSERRLRTFLQQSNGTLHHKDVIDATARIEALYQRLGYFHARVKAQGFVEKEHNIVRYLINIHEGLPVEIKTITFAGNTIFTDAVLRAQIHGVLRQELTDTGLLQTMSSTDRNLAAFEKVTGSTKRVPPEQRYLPDTIKRVLGDIATAYKNRGYLEATVGPFEASLVGNTVNVSVPIHEGPQTRIRSVSFHGNEAFTASELLTVLEEASAKQSTTSLESSGALCVPNAPFSSFGVEDARISIVRRYRDSGYLYMRLFSEVHMLKGDAQGGPFADVVYRFEEGPQVRVANVLIRGNRYTRDSLIESRMQLEPGEIYRLDEALRDQRAIASLGVFSSVRVKLIDEDLPSERKDVVAEVVERNRQAVEMQVGASTADGPRMRLDYSHVNVLGTSSTINLSLKLNRQLFFGLYGTRSELLKDRYDDFDFREQLELEARAGIRSPRLLNFPFEPTARFDVVFERDNAIPYSLDAGRTIFGIDLAPTGRSSVTIEPQFALTNLRCYAGTVGGSDTGCEGEVKNTKASRSQIGEGLRAAFKVGPTVSYDGRDDPFAPTRGFYATAKAVYAVGSTLPPSALNDDVQDTLSSNAWEPFSFTKVEGSFTAYTPGFWRTVLALSARAGGVVTGEAPIDERFYLGGSNSMRGFFSDAMWPDDVCVRARNPRTAGRTNCVGPAVPYNTKDGVFTQVSTGGNVFALFKAELRIPVLDKMSVGVFSDIGNLWWQAPQISEAVIRLNGGAGLRYATPAGPIGLDIGINPMPRAIKGERLVEVQFAMGVF